MSPSAPKAAPAAGAAIAAAVDALDTGERAPAQTVGVVLAALLGAVALNLHHTAVWCAPLALAVAAWRARTWRTRPKLPGLALRTGAVIVLTVAAGLHFHSGGSMGAAASLLVVGAALKLSETSARRDWLVVLSAALFLLLAAVLDEQSLWRLPLYALELWLLCSGLYALGAGRDAPSPATLLMSSGRSLAAALPLAVVLFLFFPRLPGAFWAVPNPNGAITGLGNELDPGSITQLAASSEAAMRVRFDGALPPLNQRYWRGPVLHDFDGSIWFRGPRDLTAPVPLQYGGTRYQYEISLEPNEHRVLIAMDVPIARPQALDSVWTYDYQLISRTPLIHPVSYQLTSYAQHRGPAMLSSVEREVDLDLRREGHRNPRSVQLAQQLRASAGSDAAYVSAVLDYLRKGGFSYTLDPPALGLNSIDDLLFRTRQGFCGHYASAFAMLMRAGGVPAHVVTGYLGGEWNRFGDYLLVRQSAAHAWDEVWLDGRGWVRVDPTAVVSPSSLSEQLAGVVLDAGGGGHMVTATWLLTTAQAWQAANAWWQDRVVGFNFARQLSLLERLDLGSMQWRALVWVVGAAGALWLALMAWAQRPRAGRGTDALGRAWRDLERKLELSVAARAPYEGPLAFAERVGRLRPELGAGIRSLARRYARLRYGPAASAAELAHFRNAVRAWRPRLRLRRPRSPARR
jgi:transglutaminase-like putative cysteine protease